MPEWVPYVLTALVSIGASYFTFRIRFERFQAMDEAREKNWIDWRARLEERVTRMDNREQAHEQYCDGRWNQLMKEHGAITAQLQMMNNHRGRQ